MNPREKINSMDKEREEYVFYKIETETHIYLTYERDKYLTIIKILESISIEPKEILASSKEMTIKYAGKKFIEL